MDFVAAPSVTWRCWDFGDRGWELPGFEGRCLFITWCDSVPHWSSEAVPTKQLHQHAKHLMPAPAGDTECDPRSQNRAGIFCSSLATLLQLCFKEGKDTEGEKKNLFAFLRVMK